ENDSFSPEEASKPEEEQKPEELPKPEEKKQEDTEGTNMKLLDMESRLAQSEAAKNQIQQEEQMKNNALQAKLSEMESKLAQVQQEEQMKNNALQAKLSEMESKLAQVLQEEQMKNNALQAKLSEMESKLAQVLQEGRPQENNELQTKLSEMESKLSQLEAAKNQALQEEQMKNKELQARLFEMESRFAAGAMGTQDAPAFAPTPFSPIEEGAATGVGKAGAIRDLMAHLIKSQHDVATCSKVCRSLEDISFDDVDGQQELISSGAVEVILSLLRAHQECDPLLLKPMMDSFWNLTYDEQAVDRATAHGAVDCVTTIMAKHTSCAELEVGCCGVLLNLAVMDKNRRRIVEIGAGPLVANVVQTHAACEQVVESACQLLYMLAFHADLRPMMAASTTPVAEIASRCSPNSKKWGQWLSEAPAVALGCDCGVVSFVCRAEVPKVWMPRREREGQDLEVSVLSPQRLLRINNERQCQFPFRAWLSCSAAMDEPLRWGCEGASLLVEKSSFCRRVIASRVAEGHYKSGTPIFEDVEKFEVKNLGKDADHAQRKDLKIAGLPCFAIFGTINNSFASISNVYMWMRSRLHMEGMKLNGIDALKSWPECAWHPESRPLLYRWLSKETSKENQESKGQRLVWAIFFANMLLDVDILSDDEGRKTNANCLPSPVLVPDRPPKKQQVAKRRPACKAKVKFVPSKGLDTRTLRYRVDGMCGCFGECYKPFREEGLFLSLVKIQKTLKAMSKLEQVFNLVRGQDSACRGARHLHRLIIKRLPQGPGRLAQLAQYKAHLSRQYRDRQVYWGHRAKSRKLHYGHLLDHVHLKGIGLAFADLDSKFWRTKRWMSDANYQTKVFWYLPACVATEVGQEPFVMETAAKCIEDLANNVVGRYPLLDVAAANDLRLLVDRPPAVEQRRYRRARMRNGLYKAAANFWCGMSPKKRKSGSADGPNSGKSQKTALPSIPPDSAKLPHMVLFEEWTEVLKQDGSFDQYLTKRLENKGLFAVKGWNRSVCCLAVLKAAHELPELLQALDSAAAFASAYSVGRLESQAATNLLNNVAPWVRAELKEMVRLHGQPKFLLHDGIAAGIFNSIYNGASAGFVPWDAALQNNNGVLGLLLNRMKKDFEGLTPKMRKPWGQKELEPSFHLA
ncbi:unnamed protein product, partial [Cladocopium goreaui]